MAWITLSDLTLDILYEIIISLLILKKNMNSAGA